LDNREARLNLPAHRHNPITKDRATKAALSVYESHDPSVAPESFLLIVRTSHIVTVIHE
jgi:hypothetical protein